MINLSKWICIILILGLLGCDSVKRETTDKDGVVIQDLSSLTIKGEQLDVTNLDYVTEATYPSGSESEAIAVSANSIENTTNSIKYNYTIESSVYLDSGNGHIELSIELLK